MSRPWLWEPNSAQQLFWTYRCVPDFSRCFEKNDASGLRGVAVLRAAQNPFTGCLQEYAMGVPPTLCFRSKSNGTTADEGIFPEPRSGGLRSQAQDIAFSMLEGDFTVSCSFGLLAACSLGNTISRVWSLLPYMKRTGNSRFLSVVKRTTVAQ